MAADAIFAKPTDLNSSAIYYRILIKFETEVHFAPLNMTNLVAEVPRPHKMAADAIFAKPTELSNSAIYYRILTKF